MGKLEVGAISDPRFEFRTFGRNFDEASFRMGRLSGIIPEKLWEWKIFTNRIEDEFSSNGKRRVNIDPGYIDFSKVILLSTKDFYHRIYLGEGIYAEVTMHFSKGKYHFFQWTYPDYQTGNYLKFFENLRRTYSKQIKDENVG